ncbi:MAG: Rpn family recombination-promoting nuclease/putative transposase [Lachnospiraceae bacterium]|nr:Rpn family recombination-promoting nuclease/putative transposase [Lachnospiraceae bacterium]
MTKEKEPVIDNRNIRDSSRKDFRYPPVFPIVYYEGTEKWTAPYDLADRILCRELLGDYLPHFKYQMIKLHDYSNEELLSKGDEISLAMLINKIRYTEDMEAFSRLPREHITGHAGISVRRNGEAA